MSDALKQAIDKIKGVAFDENERITLSGVTFLHFALALLDQVQAEQVCPTCCGDYMGSLGGNCPDCTDGTLESWHKKHIDTMAATISDKNQQITDLTAEVGNLRNGFDVAAKTVTEQLKQITSLKSDAQSVGNLCITLGDTKSKTLVDCAGFLQRKIENLQAENERRKKVMDDVCPCAKSPCNDYEAEIADLAAEIEQLEKQLGAAALAAIKSLASPPEKSDTYKQDSISRSLP